MQTKLVVSEGLSSRLSETVLFVDSTALIDASRHPVFMDFLSDIANTDCTLMTIPSVIYEFERGAKNSQQLDIYEEIIKTLNISTVSDMEGKVQDRSNRVFMAVYNIEACGSRKERGPSYTDSLLCLSLYAFRHTKVKLLTSNYNDVPLSMFNRDEMIMFDTGRELKTAAVYSLSAEKLSRCAKKFSEFMKCGSLNGVKKEGLK